MAERKRTSQLKPAEKKEAKMEDLDLPDIEEGELTALFGEDSIRARVKEKAAEKVEVAPIEKVRKNIIDKQIDLYTREQINGEQLFRARKQYVISDGQVWFEPKWGGELILGTKEVEEGGEKKQKPRQFYLGPADKPDDVLKGLRRFRDEVLSIPSIEERINRIAMKNKLKAEAKGIGRGRKAS